MLDRLFNHSENLPHAVERVLARSVKCEHALRDWRALSIDFNRAFELVVSVAQRWPARIDALLGLLAHSLAHFFSDF